MKQITNPRLSQISIYENIEFLNITEPNINLITGLNSIFYLTIDSVSISPITFNCSLNKNIDNKYTAALIFFYNSTSSYITLKFNKNIIWNYYTHQSDFDALSPNEPTYIVLYPKSEISLSISTFNSGLFWLMDKYSIIYNPYNYFTRPYISTPFITNAIDNETQIYILSDFNFTVSSFTPVNSTDSFKILELNVYSDLELTNKLFMKNIIPNNNIVDLSTFNLNPNTLYYVQLRYIGNQYYSDLSNIFPIKIVQS